MRFLLISLLLSGCAGLLPTPPTPSEDAKGPARFAYVALNLYRSAQPDQAQLMYLRDKYNISVVIKLNGIEAKEPKVAGVDIIDIPLSVIFTPSHDALEAVFHWIDQSLKDGKGVLVHCSHGEDRTGEVVALWEMRHGAPWRDALAEAIAHGWHPYDALWKAFAREAGW